MTAGPRWCGRDWDDGVGEAMDFCGAGLVRPGKMQAGNPQPSKPAVGGGGAVFVTEMTPVPVGFIQGSRSIRAKTPLFTGSIAAAC